MWECEKCGGVELALNVNGEPFRHTCRPAWECYNADDEDVEDAKVVYAIDEEMAAEEYAELCEHQCGEQIDDQTICVRKLGADEEWYWFKVRGETERQFYASLIEGHEDGD